MIIDSDMRVSAKIINHGLRTIKGLLKEGETNNLCQSIEIIPS